MALNPRALKPPDHIKLHVDLYYGEQGPLLPLAPAFNRSILLYFIFYYNKKESPEENSMIFAPDEHVLEA